jgi:hypothetical protein
VRRGRRAAFGDGAHLGASRIRREYDENWRVTVFGTVTRFEWTNPHAWLYVKGKDESKELKKGDQVTVEGYRAKDGSNVANASTVTPAGWPEAIRGLPNHNRRPGQVAALSGCSAFFRFSSGGAMASRKYSRHRFKIV